MKILIIGSGGREHALAWKVQQSEKVEQIFFAPGNAGTESLGINLPLSVSDFNGIRTAVVDNKIDMVLVGPEVPLVEGIHDFFLADTTLNKVSVIGPAKAGAMLEGSKKFAKSFMVRHNIPTAKHFVVKKENIDKGVEFLRGLTPPFVLKADGLAAGKGVLIIDTIDKAEASLMEILDGKFGDAGSTVVLEEFLTGVECSVFVITDGTSYKILPEAKDYKRIGEGDTGLNTGGMGAITPVPFVNDSFIKKVEKQIIEPTIAGLVKEKIPYKGFIFFGLMNSGGEPYVIEYNVRLGDPETEAIMLRIKSDFVSLLEGVANNDLAKCTVETDTRAAATVMLVSEGYPGSYRKGEEIKNLESVKESVIFHAGTIKQEDKVVSNGGRVLSISSYGDSMKEALALSYKNAKLIKFNGAYYRRDLGFDL